MKVYIAGPMSKYKDTDHNFPLFFAFAAWLRDHDHGAVNPAELDGGDTSQPYDFYLRRDLPLLVQCDAIALLPEWDESAGACLELLVALAAGLNVYEVDHLPNGDFSWWPLVMQRDCFDFVCIALRAIREKYRPIDQPVEPKLRLADSPSSPEELPEPILSEADRLVIGDRGSNYGHPFDDFSRTGRMWGAILGTLDIPPHLVALCMVALKMSRECHRPKRDNRVDMAGYVKTEQMVVDRYEQLAKEQLPRQQKEATP